MQEGLEEEGEERLGRALEVVGEWEPGIVRSRAFLRYRDAIFTEPEPVSSAY